MFDNRPVAGRLTPRSCLRWHGEDEAKRRAIEWLVDNSLVDREAAERARALSRPALKPTVGRPGTDSAATDDLTGGQWATVSLLAMSTSSSTSRFEDITCMP
jgi:hypothetical protein